MNLTYLLVLTVWLFAGDLFGQTNLFPWSQGSSEAVEMLEGLFAPDSRTNLLFSAYSNCPPQYTNVISNTNLFTTEEKRLISEVLVKHKHVTTNSGLPGSLLIGLTKTNGYCVAHYTYTNSGAHEDITFGANSDPGLARFGGGYDEFITGVSTSPLARFRDKNGDGYDITINPSDVDGASSFIFAQIKHGKVNGLFVTFDNDHCETLLHCSEGYAVGEWLEWEAADRLIKITIKSPLNYFKYMNQKIQN
jgi:hypothetical protein